MMNKSLIALAVATVVAAPAAQAVDFEVNDTTSISVYGTIEPKYVTANDASGDSQGQFADEDSTLGFAVEHAFNNDLTGFAQAEFEHQADDGGGINNTDSAFFGLKGAFGKFRIGNFDSVYEDSIIDATEVAEAAEITDEAFATEDNQIAYYSPSFGGFSFQTQVRHVGEAEGGNATGDAGTGFALVGSYAADMWQAHVGYDDTSSEIVQQFDANGNPAGTDFADNGTFGTAGIVSLGQFEIAAKAAVEDLEDNDPNGDDISYTALRGTFATGPAELWTSVQEVSPDLGTDRTEVTAGVVYELYDNLELWSEIGQFDRANDAGDDFHVGAIYSF